jgi:hypothetical protein
LAERDAEIEAMGEEELEVAGPWLLGERPDLDVDLVFRLGHPFPPLRRLAERLAFKYGFQWSEVNAIVPEPHQPRWRVARWLPAVPALTSGLIDHWRCELRLVGADGRTAELQGLADVRKGYPLHEGEVEDSWDAFFAGRLPYLPAGPWTQASWVVGEALCVHNALIEVEHFLRRASHRGPSTATARMAMAARLNETDGWTPSQPIWPAAGQRGEGGPDLVRRDTSSRSRLSNFLPSH